MDLDTQLVAPQASHSGLSQDVARLQLDTGSGLSQDIARVSLGATSFAQATGGALPQMAPSQSSGAQNNGMGELPAAVSLRRDVLEQFLGAEIGQHLELVQAAQGGQAHVAVRMPASLGQLRSLLTKAAYNVDCADPW